MQAKALGKGVVHERSKAIKSSTVKADGSPHDTESGNAHDDSYDDASGETSDSKESGGTCIDTPATDLSEAEEADDEDDEFVDALDKPSSALADREQPEHICKCELLRMPHVDPTQVEEPVMADDTVASANFLQDERNFLFY